MMERITGRGAGPHKPNQRGAAAVEFAIVISLLVLITGGIIEFGRVFWYLDALTKATRDGARYLSMSALLPLDTSEAKVLVVTAATQAGLPPTQTGKPGFDLTKVEVSCDDSPCPTIPTVAPPVYVTVTIKDYSVAFGSWFAVPLPSNPWFLAPHTTMRYMCEAGATTPC